jgi:hypothetical protein
MAVHQATITAKVGAGGQATSVVLTDIRNIDFDLDKNIVYIRLRNGQVREFAGYSTITLTVSGTTAGSNYTLTIS